MLVGRGPDHRNRRAGRRGRPRCRRGPRRRRSGRRREGDARRGCGRLWRHGRLGRRLLRERGAGLRGEGRLAARRGGRRPGRRLVLRLRLGSGGRGRRRLLRGNLRGGPGRQPRLGGPREERGLPEKAVENDAAAESAILRPRDSATSAACGSQGDVPAAAASSLGNQLCLLVRPMQTSWGAAPDADSSPRAALSLGPSAAATFGPGSVKS